MMKPIFFILLLVMFIPLVHGDKIVCVYFDENLENMFTKTYDSNKMYQCPPVIKDFHKLNYEDTWPPGNASLISKGNVTLVTERKVEQNKTIMEGQKKNFQLLYSPKFWIVIAILVFMAYLYFKNQDKKGKKKK
jgi:hypothetical protein